MIDQSLSVSRAGNDLSCYLWSIVEVGGTLTNTNLDLRRVHSVVQECRLHNHEDSHPTGNRRNVTGCW